MDLSNRIKMIEAFKEGYLSISASYSAHLPEIIEQAEKILAWTGETSELSPTAGNFGKFIEALTVSALVSALESKSKDLSEAGAAVLKRSYDEMLLKIPEETNQNVAMFENDKELTSDLDRAATYMCSIIANRKGGAAADAAYPKIMESNPQTIWDMFCKFPMMLG